MSEKLLTIGIPTYNRREELDKSLSVLLPQVQLYGTDINVIVADNASSNDAKSVIDSYIERGFELSYYRHEENLGMDGNFVFLYNKCDTKYFWMLSDDDLLLPGALNKIMSVIKGEEFGSLYLNNYWFDDEVNLESIQQKSSKISLVKYTEVLDYVDRVNYWITFISANIINKDLIKVEIDFSRFEKTLLSQLSWIIPAMTTNKPNFVIEDYILACKANNTGGYRLFEVFGKNLNNILLSYVKKGLDAKIRHVINSHLVKSFFPLFVNSKNEKFNKEKYLFVLLPIFWRYGNFWKYNFFSLLKRQFYFK